MLVLFLLVVAMAALAAEPVCADSDGGISPGIVGTVSGFRVDGEPYERTDVCKSDILLKEYYCDGAVKAFVIVACHGGCIDGRCVNLPMVFSARTP